MLAFAAAPRYRDPWAPSPEDARPVSLDDLGIEMDMYARNHAMTSRLRANMGLPTTDPGLEQTMKDVGLWPEEAKPLPFDVALVISRLPIRQRTAVYGRLAGLSFEEMARQMGVAKGTVAATLTTPCRDLHLAARCFGVMPASCPDQLVGVHAASRVIGMSSTSVQSRGNRLGIKWEPMESDACWRGCSRPDFILLWWDYIDAFCNGVRGR